MQQDVIASLDFGSKKLSASIAVKNQNDEIEILGVKSCKSLGIEKGLLKNIEKCRKTVVALLKDLEDKTGKNTKNISIGISARKVRITEVTISTILEEKVTKEDIANVLSMGKKSVTISSDETIVDVLINFYILDGKVIHKDILNWKGVNLEVNLTLVIAEKKEIDKYYELFNETKYKIEFIKLNILAGKQIFLNEKNSIGDIALIDVGAADIDIAIFNNGIPKNIASIPLGGNNISNDLAICGDISFSEAENLKKISSSNYKSIYEDDSINDEIKVGTTKVSKELFYKVTNARIEEILNHINMELKKTGHYDRICSIILYGDGLSYFEDINEIVGNIFEVKAKIINKIDLGIKNSENITSLAIAKEVYDRLNLLGDNSKILTSDSIEKKKVIETENVDNDESKNHILKKFKDFFEKIF